VYAPLSVVQGKEMADLLFLLEPTHLQVGPRRRAPVRGPPARPRGAGGAPPARRPRAPHGRARGHPPGSGRPRWDHATAPALCCMGATTIGSQGRNGMAFLHAELNFCFEYIVYTLWVCLELVLCILRTCWTLCLLVFLLPPCRCWSRRGAPSGSTSPFYRPSAAPTPAAACSGGRGGAEREEAQGEGEGWGGEGSGGGKGERGDPYLVARPRPRPRQPPPPLRLLSTLASPRCAPSCLPQVSALLLQTCATHSDMLLRKVKPAGSQTLFSLLYCFFCNTVFNAGSCTETWYLFTCLCVCLYMCSYVDLVLERRVNHSRGVPLTLTMWLLVSPTTTETWHGMTNIQYSVNTSRNRWRPVIILFGPLSLCVQVCLVQLRFRLISEWCTPEVLSRYATGSRERPEQYCTAQNSVSVYSAVRFSTCKARWALSRGLASPSSALNQSTVDLLCHCVTVSQRCFAVSLCPCACPPSGRGLPQLCP